MTQSRRISPRPDAAIFADTQAEPPSVYRWLDWLEAEIARLPYAFPVHRVTAGDLRASAIAQRTSKRGRTYSVTSIPLFTRDTATGKPGMIRQRSCTRDFKIVPIRRWARRAAGIKRGQAEVTVTQWIGISWDEIQRVKDAREAWVQNRHPLIERRMRRADCIAWMRSHGYPEPPRSACSFCPFHSDDEWRRLRDDEPDAFADAVLFERQVQAARAGPTSTSTSYLHPSMVPLDEVDLSTAAERGQLALWQDWNVECEGMCGV